MEDQHVLGLFAHDEWWSFYISVPLLIFAQHDPLGKPDQDQELIQAKAEIMSSGPVLAILENQSPEGFWVRPGGGYTPSYRGTIWQIMFLAWLGADPMDGRVRKACEYVIEHSSASTGAFSMNRKPIPSKVFHCLNGDLTAALIRLGYANDSRLAAAIDWTVGAIVGGEHIRFYKSGTSGPDFCCAYNAGQPCAWGAVKTLNFKMWVNVEQKGQPSKWVSLRALRAVKGIPS